MAEKKVIIFTCDRCGMDHNRLRGKSLPAGWSNVAGNDLCPPCLKGLASYLEGHPTQGVKVEHAGIKQPLRRSSDEMEQTVVSENEDGTPRLVMNTPLISEGEGVKI